MSGFYVVFIFFMSMLGFGKYGIGFYFVGFYFFGNASYFFSCVGVMFVFVIVILGSLLFFVMLFIVFIVLL